MNYISIGGWCGTKIALKDLGLFNEPSLPFDSVRTSIEGIINCIENDFQNFFPKEIKKDNRFPNWIGYVGEYVGFYHHNHNLLDKNVIESFERKFIRFDEKIKKNNCIFLRTIARENYIDEIVHYKTLQNVIDKKYPNISYIICFIIPDQPNTQYYKNLDDRTFLFTLNDKSYNNANLKNEYKPIFDFIVNENLFINIPMSNDIEIINSLRVWLVDGYPMVNFIEK
jgi:lambda repressor-like predicted transcriptional regulator